MSLAPTRLQDLDKRTDFIRLSYRIQIQIRHFIFLSRIPADALQYFFFTTHFTLFFFHISVIDSFANVGNSRPLPHALAALYTIKRGK